MTRATPAGSHLRARYTQDVGWNVRTISITMLMVLSLLPLSGTLCAVVCDIARAEGSGHHHGASQEADQSAPDAHFDAGPSAHPCDHSTAILQFTTAAERTQVATTVQPSVLVSVETFTAPTIRRTRAAAGAPPGSPPTSSTPLVLRI